MFFNSLYPAVMTAYPMHYTDNANSWRRMAMLARLYWPCLRSGVITCAVAPALLIFVCSLICHLSGFFPNWLIVWPIAGLLYLSPGFFATRDYRDISAQLPVTAGEKLGFLTMACVIVFPAIILVSGAIGEVCSAWAFGTEVKSQLEAVGDMMTIREAGMPVGITLLLGLVSMISLIAIALYYVVAAKANRTAAVILSVVIAYIAITFISGIAGGVIGVVKGPEIAVGADAASIEAALQATIMEFMKWVAVGLSALEVVVGAIFLVKLYKKLRNCGF